MRALFKVASAMLVLAFLLIGLAYGALRSQGLARPANAEGRSLASDKRSVDKEINAVELSGPIELTLRQGAIASLEVRGEQRLLPNIETSVDGGTLHIETKGMLLHHRLPLQVVLVLPSLDTLKFHGTGESTVNGFSGERIEVEMTGSGDVKFNGRYREVVASLHGSGDLELNGGNSERVEVELKGNGDLTVVGSCKQFKADQTGSGDLNAEHLTAQAANVELNGSGTALVLAKKSVDVSLNGSGKVSVYGQPEQRTVNSTGSGAVNFR